MVSSWPSRVRRAALEPSLPTPTLLLDTATVAAKLAAFRAAMPDADVFYAVKANPDPAVLSTVLAGGARFDIASPAELAACVAAGANPAHLSYANTVKRGADIASAYAAGVRMFAADSRLEVAKVARHAPGAKLFIRLETSGDGAVWALGSKFGTTVSEAAALLVAAADAGLRPWGVSFHVGSQQLQPQAYVRALSDAAAVFELCAAAGVRLRMVDVGGGFPAGGYVDAVPDIGVYGSTITAAFRARFDPSKVALVAEPGRALVADAGWMVSEVVADHVRVTAAGPTRWVVIDAGIYAGFVEAVGEAIEFDVRPARPAAARMSPAIVAGPTCDSVDVFHSSRPIVLPQLAPGDRIVIGSAGAYTTMIASVGFNGFAPPAVHVL